jgi:hypothetical protein
VKSNYRLNHVQLIQQIIWTNRRREMAKRELENNFVKEAQYILNHYDDHILRKELSDYMYN